MRIFDDGVYFSEGYLYCGPCAGALADDPEYGAPIRRFDGTPEPDDICLGCGDRFTDGDGADRPSQSLSGIPVQITDEDGNIFFIMGRVSRALKRGGRSDLVDPFLDEIKATGSYTAALGVVERYVDVW